VVAAGVDLVPASVGALAEDQFLEVLCNAASGSNSTIRIPSGAIAGIDGLAAARHFGLASVTYRGTMPPHALKGHVPDSFTEGRVAVFAGNARDAVNMFPKNANLTGTIALAGIGFERTRVELYIDSSVRSNVHELHVVGAFGEFSVKVAGVRISNQSPSSRIVPGSLVQAALGSSFIRL
jgi:aspartate dehydrogenase